MLDMGFREDIEKILGQAAPDRQTVFFSATLPPAIQGMIRRFAREPHHIRIESQTMEAPNIEQMYYEVGHGSKLEVLCRLIDLHDFKIGIIFCGTKMGVDQLAEHLQARGYAVDKLHGDIAQQARERVMRRFRERKIEFLIATDVAARGIDVDDVEVVFNYDLPHDPEDYVHRIGRTGRAGRSGRAVSFIAGREIYKLQQILRFTKGRIRRETIPSLDTLEEKRTTSLLEGVRTTLESGEFRKFDSAVDNLVEAGHAPTDIVSALLHLLAGEGGRTGERIPEDNPKPPREAYPSYAGGRGNTRATRGETRDKPNTDEGPLRPARAPAGERPARASAEERPARPSAEERPSRPPAGAREERPARTEERAPQRPREDRPARPATEDAPVSHEQGMTRLALNVGREHGIEPGDVVGVIAGVSRLPREIIGAIRLQPQETWVDVATEHVETVIGKLNGIKFKGHRLAASLAVESAARKKKAVRKE